MKYAVLIGDGMADFPLDELDGRTPLDVADVANMDEIARRGVVGMVSTTPEGYPPGSYSGNMSLLGYDPREYYCGRAPIEAANIGVELGDDDVAFRCNCVTLVDGKMDDFSAGKISTEEAGELIAALDERLGRDGISFHAGTSYRNLTVFGPPAPDCCATSWRSPSASLTATPSTNEGNARTNRRRTQSGSGARADGRTCRCSGTFTA
jgi:2,3-bisphosphoglycerate-independent phosphoglycerate mutase